MAARLSPTRPLWAPKPLRTETRLQSDTPTRPSRPSPTRPLHPSLPSQTPCRGVPCGRPIPSAQKPTSNQRHQHGPLALLRAPPWIKRPLPFAVRRFPPIPLIPKIPPNPRSDKIPVPLQFWASPNPRPSTLTPCHLSAAPPRPALLAPRRTPMPSYAASRLASPPPGGAVRLPESLATIPGGKHRRRAGGHPRPPHPLPYTPPSPLTPPVPRSSPALPLSSFVPLRVPPWIKRRCRSPLPFAVRRFPPSP